MSGSAIARQLGLHVTRACEIIKEHKSELELQRAFAVIVELVGPERAKRLLDDHQWALLRMVKDHEWYPTHEDVTAWAKIQDDFRRAAMQKP
jgi:hypothetical protein